MSNKISITTTDAPAPAHSFPQGIRKGPMLQVSGQGPVDPVSGQYVHANDVAAQTLRTLANVDAVVAAGGATFNDVIMLRVYLTDREHFAAMNSAYTQFIESAVTDDVYPCRTTVFVQLPRPEMLIEIDALAVV